MKNNVIIQFNLENEVKIYFNNEYIATSGYKDKYEFQTDKNGLLEFKVGIKKASINITSTKTNNISVEKVNGQLKAKIIFDKIPNTNIQKEYNEINDIPSESNNAAIENIDSATQKANKSSIYSAIFIVILLGFIFVPKLFNQPCMSFEGNHTITCSQMQAIEDNAKEQLRSQYEIISFISVEIDSYSSSLDCYNGTATFKAPNGFGEVKEWSKSFFCVKE